MNFDPFTISSVSHSFDVIFQFISNFPISFVIAPLIHYCLRWLTSLLSAGGPQLHYKFPVCFLSGSSPTPSLSHSKETFILCSSRICLHGLMRVEMKISGSFTASFVIWDCRQIREKWSVHMICAHICVDGRPSMRLPHGISHALLGHSSFPASYSLQGR